MQLLQFPECNGFVTTRQVVVAVELIAYIQFVIYLGVNDCHEIFYRFCCSHCS